MDSCYREWLKSPDNNHTDIVLPLQKQMHQFEDWVLTHFVDALPAAGTGWMSE